MHVWFLPGLKRLMNNENVRDLGLASCEELLFLKLYPFPRRIADHAGEAA